MTAQASRAGLPSGPIRWQYWNQPDRRVPSIQLFVNGWAVPFEIDTGVKHTATNQEIPRRYCHRSRALPSVRKRRLELEVVDLLAGVPETRMGREEIGFL